MNKRGDFTVQQMVQWIGYMIIFIFFFVITYYIISGAVKKEVDISDATIDIYMVRFLEDGDCLAYQKNGVADRGVIDINKFNSVVLNNCLNRDGFSAQLSLNYNGKILDATNNEDEFTLDSRLCFSPRYHCKSKEFYTLVLGSNKLHNATMNMSVVLNVK